MKIFKKKIMEKPKTYQVIALALAWVRACIIWGSLDTGIVIASHLNSWVTTRTTGVKGVG